MLSLKIRFIELFFGFESEYLVFGGVACVLGSNAFPLRDCLCLFDFSRWFVGFELEYLTPRCFIFVS